MLSIPEQDKALINAGENAIMYADRAWKKDIVDPTRKAWGDPAFAEDRAFINDIIKSERHGLGWPTVSVATKDYRWDGDFEWCGAFAAFCWDIVDLNIRKHYYASTYRLFRYARYLGPPNKFATFMKQAPAGTIARKYTELVGSDDAKAGLVDVFAPRKGDILIVNGSDRFGQHITLIESWDAQKRTFETIEGNATGRGPKGNRHQGVIRHTRTIAQAKHIYRPGFADLIGWDK